MCDNWVHETIRNERTTGASPPACPGLAATRPEPQASGPTGRRDGAECPALATEIQTAPTQARGAWTGASLPLDSLSAPALGTCPRAWGDAYGYAEDYWTLDRIAHRIWDLFRVRYRPSGVWYLLQRLGWSCQKPQRRTLQRDDEAIAHWKHYVWPHIKKVADPARNPRLY